MRTIDILTTQNVTINYEVAEVKDRILATFIDMLIIVIGNLILQLIFVTSGLIPEDYFNYFVVIPILFFYHLICEILMDGQSPGKKILGIKVVKLTGTEPSINDYLMRWALRPVDILFSLGSIGVMMVSSSDKGQRLGDIVANTTLIKVNPTQKILLEDILNIRSLENYEPVYGNVREFNEKEMLLLKEVMDKSIKYQNAAHYQALEDAVNLVKHRLDLAKVPADKIGFIRTLIKDYVALSR